MPAPCLRRAASTLALLAATSSPAACTLGKPLVCAVSAPLYVLGHGGAGAGGDGLACALLAISATGAAAGLVTGVISDLNYLTDRTSDPYRNLTNPFATNAR